MKRIILLLSAMFLVLPQQAQNRLDILTLSGRFTPPQSYENATYPGTAQESGSFVGITVPVPITKNTIFYNSLNYFYFHVSNEASLPDGIIDPVNLHGFILRTGLVQNFSEGRSLQLLLAPRFMTDARGGGMDNFQFGGLAMYQKVFSSRFTLGLGAMFNTDFFGPYLVPLVNLDWKITDRFSISGMLPIYAKIKYQASERFQLGISHFGLTTTFGLNDPDYADDYLERQSIDLALFGNYNIARNLYVEARIGQSMGRCYRQYGMDQKVSFAMPLATFGDNRVLKNAEFEDGMFAELRLIYSIEIPE
ncbi:MAG: hypothetical protein JW801_16905 [Bacteroidales bacterium]|nr:hypothetical protein [Bacteroidales bacterium]